MILALTSRAPFERKKSISSTLREHPYVISKDYEEKLKSRRLLFMDATSESKGVVLTMITPNGLKKGLHSSFIHSEITAKDLFFE
ncbi:MAG: hypothetical protein KBT33_12895 [Prevotellaceae bacterium]|nr:hypothetical protein [Candidatus Minthosoma equi]